MIEEVSFLKKMIGRSKLETTNKNMSFFFDKVTNFTIKPLWGRII